MRLRIHQVSVKLEYEKPDVVTAVARILDCPIDRLENLELLRRSVDARRKDAPPRFVLSVDVDYLGDADPRLRPGRIELAVEKRTEPPVPSRSPSDHRPVVVGAGPAGLMAALTLAEAGHRPLLLERGADVRIRSHQVETFCKRVF